MHKNKRQLITGDQAVKSNFQHKSPCSDCPWSRKALNGWLGDTSAQQWLRNVNGETRMDCHTVSNQQCAGAAIYRRNIAKLPRDPTQLVLPADRDKVFAGPSEFLEHHEKKPDVG